MTESMFIVAGLAFLPVGAGLYLTSSPMSESDAIPGAILAFVGPATGMAATNPREEGQR